MLDLNRLEDTIAFAMDRARGAQDHAGLIGYGAITLERASGDDLYVPFHNLITDAGDLYAAGKVIAGISPANAAAPTAASGMKLGTGSTAAAKAGAGAALVTYISGSNATFATSYPQTNNLGSGLGVEARYQCAWAAGTATNSAITEAVIVNDAASNATSSAANTYSRVVFAAIDKQAGDSLTFTWNWKYLGA